MTCPNADREVSELTDAEAEAAVLGHTSEQELTPQRSTMNRAVLAAGDHYHTIAAGSGPE